MKRVPLRQEMDRDRELEDELESARIVFTSHKDNGRRAIIHLEEGMILPLSFTYAAQVIGLRTPDAALDMFLGPEDEDPDAPADPKAPHLAATSLWDEDFDAFGEVVTRFTVFSGEHPRAGKPELVVLMGLVWDRWLKEWGAELHMSGPKKAPTSYELRRNG